MQTTHDHFRHLLELLNMESEAEAQRIAQQTEKLSDEAAERTGNSLRRLAIRDHQAALGGRVLVTLGPRNRGQTLPWNRLGVGTPVVISSRADAHPVGWRGVVSARDEATIQVALDTLPTAWDAAELVDVNLSFDEVARLRQRAALVQAEQADRGRLARLRDVLVGLRPATFHTAEPPQAIDRGLNRSQCQAVEFGLSANDVAIIQGPPGTGKTTTVVEIIRQAARRGEKVLACAPSNLAVDHLLERLLLRGQAAIRLGHPARVVPELQRHTLDLLVDAHPDVALARKLARKALSLREKASKFRRTRPARGSRQALRSEAAQLLADARRLEHHAARQIIDAAPVICATLTGVDDSILGRQRFHWAVIDEAAQATEPACWIPLLRSERVVLAGDHCQLPPTIISAQAAREGFSVSLMERLAKQLGPDAVQLLTIQYRMHHAVMGFSSEEFYRGALIADPSVCQHTLADLPSVAQTPGTRQPLEFIDTAGAGYDEQQEPDGESRLNAQEADWVERKVYALLDAGLPARDIAVITPYAAQVRLLRSRMPISGLEIDTVDGFQGREKEAVVVSLVRSNARGEIGFLADVRRTNVALTRARRKLIVIGDSATIAGHPFYHRLVEYFEAHGAYRTVWDLES